MTGVRWKQLAIERFRTSVLMVFAGTAVFLAVVGIFGVESDSVVQRTREVGLRIAIGATRGQVTRLLMRALCVFGKGVDLGSHSRNRYTFVRHRSDAA